MLFFILFREIYFVVAGVIDLRWGFFKGREERDIAQAIPHPEWRKNPVGFI